MSKINLQKVTLTPADAAEALETIALMESDGRGLAAADLMYDDPHEPPYWWHNSRMVNLTLLARTVAAQEGTAPAPGNSRPWTDPHDDIACAAALFRLKDKLTKWKNGAEPIPQAILPTYEGQTWIDVSKLDYRFDRPERHPDPDFHWQEWHHMQSTLVVLLEEVLPTEESIHGARCRICYDPSDLNVRVSPDYYFAKGVPGPGIKATGPYLIWEIGKPPDFVLEMASPTKAREDLTTKRKLYEKIGITEYWRLDPTGGDLYGAPLAADRLEEGCYRPIPLHRTEKDLVWGYSEAALINIFWIEGFFVYQKPTRET